MIELLKELRDKVSLARVRQHVAVDAVVEEGEGRRRRGGGVIVVVVKVVRVVAGGVMVQVVLVVVVQVVRHHRGVEVEAGRGGRS